MAAWVAAPVHLRMALTEGRSGMSLPSRQP
jgi:hypothetical protein